MSTMKSKRRPELGVDSAGPQPPQEVVDRLLRRGIVATVTPYAQSYARVAPSILNTTAEIDRALRALASLR
jgi:selenocysteine lyase/cysteine desulfurase